MFGENSSDIAFTQCPCGGDVIEMSLSYNCVKCRSKINKEFYNKSITQTQAKKLFAKEAIKVKNLEVNGEGFDAKIEFKNRYLTYTKV